ncbi:hypothetical protein ACIBI3_02215 [Actinomadura luteofluorescens]|uniref:hypothetical protein n=1 Tax=Actinomadura luteofluorescens TaxID=46163 RepID=UPI00348585D3
MHALIYLAVGTVAGLGALAMVYGDPTALEQYTPVAEAPPLPGPPPLDDDQDDADDAFTSNWGVDG